MTPPRQRVYSSPMKRSHLFLLITALSLLGLIGCSTTKTLTYDITVRNQTGHPLTLWLTKDGPPSENGWRSPEEVAASAPGHEERIGGIVVPSGKTAYTGQIQGHFQPGSTAWLRIYDGQYKLFSDLLAVSPQSLVRKDYPLDPGKNFLVIKETAGKLDVQSEGLKLTLPGGP